MPLPDGNPGWLHRPLTSLRPWGIAALLLLGVEGLLRLCLPPDPRVLQQPLRAQACLADAALAALVAARRAPLPTPAAEAAWDIVLLGDSVLGSVNNPPGQRLGDYLQDALVRSGRPVRVHNLSAGAAHAGDQYGALLRLHQHLAATPLGLQRLLIVLSTNPIFFSRRHSQPPLSFPCVFDDLAPQTDLLPDELRRRLGLSAPPPGWHRALAFGLARGSYLYQQRRRLGESVFGDHTTLSEALQAGLRRLRPPAATDLPQADQPWSQRGLIAERYRDSYDFLPLDHPEALNVELTRRLASYLLAHPELHVLVEQVPQNHYMMTELAGSDSYRQLSQWLRDRFTQPGLVFRSHDGTEALRSEHFTDLDHLTSAGNQALAQLLADDIAALLSAQHSSP